MAKWDLKEAQVEPITNIVRTNDKRCEYCGAFEGMGHAFKCVKEPRPGKPPGHILVAIPDEVMPYSTEIQRFADAMVYKLSVHSRKGKWENLDVFTAIDKMEGEVHELREAVNRGNMVEILLESADVANYGLIVSAIAVDKK